MYTAKDNQVLGSVRHIRCIYGRQESKRIIAKCLFPYLINTQHKYNEYLGVMSRELNFLMPNMEVSVSNIEYNLYFCYKVCGISHLGRI